MKSGGNSGSEAAPRGPSDLLRGAHDLRAPPDRRAWGADGRRVSPLFAPESNPAAPASFLLRGEPIPALPDEDRMYLGNRARVQEALRARDAAGALFCDPLNLRYATGTRNMSLWTMHNMVRYVFVPAEGATVMFEFAESRHLSEGRACVDEVRDAVSWDFFGGGDRCRERADKWADEIADLVRRAGGANMRLAVDRVNPYGAEALRARGVSLLDGLEVAERCRARKSVDEVSAALRSLQVCQHALSGLQEALVPGVTENQVWARMQEVNLANGGEWVETRLLASGPRTNPWFQECSERVIGAGELVSVDTDLVGPYGMCSDISRSFVCPGGGAVRDDYRRAFGLAVAQLRHNIALLRPGVTSREFAEKNFQLPEAFLPNRYSLVLHGIGMADEWPSAYYREDMNALSPAFTLEEGMTVCVESYVGRSGGDFGIKLEEQVLIGGEGPIVLSSYPYDALLSGVPWV